MAIGSALAEIGTQLGDGLRQLSFAGWDSGFQDQLSDE